MIILERLRTDPDRYPPPGHRRPFGWSRGRVRHILANPICTDQTVRGRTRGGRLVPPSVWITSVTGNHPAIVDPDFFDATQRRPITGAKPNSSHRPPRPPAPKATRADLDPGEVAPPDQRVPRRAAIWRHRR